MSDLPKLRRYSEGYPPGMGMEEDPNGEWVRFWDLEEPTERPPIGYWCCAMDWDRGSFRTGDCITRTTSPDPAWTRIYGRPTND